MISISNSWNTQTWEEIRKCAKIKQRQNPKKKIQWKEPEGDMEFIRILQKSTEEEVKDKWTNTSWRKNQKPNLKNRNGRGKGEKTGGRWKENEREPNQHKYRLILTAKPGPPDRQQKGEMQQEPHPAAKRGNHSISHREENALKKGNLWDERTRRGIPNQQRNLLPLRRNIRGKKRNSRDISRTAQDGGQKKLPR